jgi:hypothetical protein
MRPSGMSVIENQPRSAIASETARLRAQTALRDHPSCFWTRQPKAPLETVDDVRLIIRRLRQNGGPEAWRTARSIDECL